MEEEEKRRKGREKEEEKEEEEEEERKAKSCRQCIKKTEIQSTRVFATKEWVRLKLGT